MRLGRRPLDIVNAGALESQLFPTRNNLVSSSLLSSSTASLQGCRGAGLQGAELVQREGKLERHGAELVRQLCQSAHRALAACREDLEAALRYDSAKGSAFQKLEWLGA